MVKWCNLTLNNMARDSVIDLRDSPSDWFAPSVTADFPEDLLICGSFYLRDSLIFAKNQLAPSVPTYCWSLPKYL